MIAKFECECGYAYELRFEVRKSQLNPKGFILGYDDLKEWVTRQPEPVCTYQCSCGKMIEIKQGQVTFED